MTSKRQPEKKPPKNKLSEEERIDDTEDREEVYRELGRNLAKAVLRDNIHVTRRWWQFIGLSFIRGLFMGLGSIIGATILVAVVIWLLNAFDGMPIIGEWFERLQSQLQSGADQLP